MLSYVLPLRTDDRADVSELSGYLRRVAKHLDDVIVVDNSSPAEIARHRAAFGDDIRVMSSEQTTPMAKVGNVMTGLAHARHDTVVIADDDVRYAPSQLRQISQRLDSSAIVRPQNYFMVLPWHARVDTTRTLLARATGGDWPGTFAVSRTALLGCGGYNGDVLFENLEMVRTVRACGGREAVALDLLIARTPPTTKHFVSQQIRQAYDEFARPARLLGSLAVLPLAVGAALRRKTRAGLAASLTVIAVAEFGRRRAGGRYVYPASSTLLAPPWLIWRSACSWIALATFARGGVRYHDTRFRRAATPMRTLRRRYRSTR